MAQVALLSRMLRLFLVCLLCSARVSGDDCEAELGAPCANGAVCNAKIGDYIVFAFCECKGDFHGLTCETPGKLDRVVPLPETAVYYDKKSPKIGTKSFLGIFVNKFGENFAGKLKLPGHELSFDEKAFLNENFKNYATRHASQLNYYNSWMKDESRKYKKDMRFLVYPVSTYKLLTDFECSVELGNLVDQKMEVQYRAKFKFSVLENKGACVPQVELKDCAQESTQVTNWNRGGENVVRSSAERSCNATYKTTFERTWTVFKMCTLIDGDPTSIPFPMDTQIPDYYFGKCVKSAFTAKETKELRVPLYTLEYGINAITLFVVEKPGVRMDKTMGSNTAVCWVNVKPVPLKAKIEGSDFKTVSEKTKVVLDGTPSYDPNEPTDSQAIRYQWSCFVEADPDDSDCKKGVVLGEDVKFTPAFKLKLGNPYSFQLKVESGLSGDTIPPPDTIIQQILVIIGDPPTLDIVCILNCAYVSRASHTEVVFLQVVCVKSCAPDLTADKYEWSSDASPDLDWDTDTQFGKNSDKLAIKAGVLQEGRVYTFTVTLEGDMGTSTDKYMIKMNKRPIIATDPPCTWSPETGTTETDFVVTCQGFTDEDEDWPLRFFIYQSDTLDHGGEENYGVVMAYLLVEYPWQFDKRQLRLMEGDPDNDFKSTITVKVKDHFGMDVVFSFELQINERTPWTEELVAQMYAGEDPSSPQIPSVTAMLEGGDSSRAVRLITTLSQGLARIADEQDSEKLHHFRIDMKEKFVTDLGKIPVKTASALDQVTGALQKVLQGDKEAVHHGSARKAANILHHLSGYLLTRAYRDTLPGHLPTKEVKKIAQTVLSSLSSILVGVSDEPKPVTPPPTAVQDVEYPLYDDYEGDAVETVVDSNIAATHMIKSIDLLGKSIAYRLAESLGESVIHTEHIALCVIVDRPTKLTERFMGDQGAGINLSPKLGQAIEAISPVINLQVATTKKNPLWFKKHLKPMNGDYVFLTMDNRKPKTVSLEERSWKRTERSIGYTPVEPLDVFLPLASTGSVFTENETTVTLTKEYLDLEYEIVVYKVVVEEGSLLRVDFKEDASYPRLSAVLTREERPGIADFDNAHSIPSQSDGDADKYAILFPDKVEDGKSEWFYLGLLPNLDDIKKSIAKGDTELAFKYAFMLSSIKCCYWSLWKNIWMSEGCIMMPDTTKSQLHCQCKHLSLFSGSFMTTPNKIDPFHAVDLFLTTMFDNPLIIGLIVTILILLILALVWARFKRRDDSRARCITVLEDNRYHDRCGYLIVVHTGRQRQAGTSSNIGIQLLGSRSNSNSHILKDSARPMLSRSSDRWFLMFARENLGEIKTVRLWSDSSGHYPAWFCDKIMVTCLETKCTQVFIVNKWLSLTLGDGSVYRVIDSATKQEIFAKKQLFNDYFRLGFRDSHLWAGIWFMHPRSAFTRAERVGVLGCFVMTIMFVNLVLYDIPNSANPATQIDNFIYAITTREMLIAFAGLMVAIPFAFIITLFFIKSKYFEDREPMKLLPKEECCDDPFAKMETGEKVGEITCLFNEDDFELVEGSSVARTVFFLLMVEPLVPAKTCKPPTGAKSPRCVCEGKCECPPRHKTSATGDCAFQLRTVRQSQSSVGSGYYWFPHWFVYVAWTICICTIVISAIFIIFFGSLFGEIKTWLWLTSVVFAVTFSILVVEPLKIVFVASLHALVFKKCPKTMRPDCDIDVKHGGKKEGGFQFENYDERLKHRSLRKMYRPLPLKEREEIKSTIELKNKLSDMCIDLVLFVIFILCLYVVVWYSRDTLAFESTKNIHNMVVAGSYGTQSEFDGVNTMIKFQEFLQDTVIHGLQATDNYNDQPTNDIGVASDFSTHLLGIPRIRQLRVRDNSCPVHEFFKGTITECRPDFNWFTADTSNYSVGWTHKYKAYEDLGAKLTEPWLFREAQETGSLPMRGQFSTYPGSGYVANLGRTRRNSLIILQFLFDYEWFDPNTRVVFVEFSTYSSSRNLFNVVALVAERGATGDWEATENIKTVKLLVTTTEATVGGKIAFVVCAIVLLLHLLRNLSKLFRVGWKKFFTHMWNVVDFFIVCLCIACIVLYIQRSSYVSALLKQLEETQHNDYVSFQAAAFWDIILGYAIAILVCIATVRIWKLLRFGDKFRMLELTLYSAAGALGSLLITLMVLMSMFVLFANLLMGNNVEYFRDPYRSLTTLLASTIGFHDLDMDELWAAHPLLGPLFFLCFLIVSSIYLVNMFITVVMCYYEAAQWNVVEKKSNYGPVDYLRDELRFHFGICKKKEERLRGGADISTYPIAVPKPEKIREGNAESLAHYRMEAMRLLTVDSMKSGVKGRDVKGDDGQDVSEERLEAMLLITLAEFTKDDDNDEEKEVEVFYKGRVKDEAKLVPESRVLDAENLLNTFGKSRKTVNQETLEKEAGGDMAEEYERLNNNLDYLSHLLDKMDFEPEAIETKDEIEKIPTLGDKIEIKVARRPFAAKSIQRDTDIPESPISKNAPKGEPYIRPLGCRPIDGSEKSPRRPCLPHPQAPRIDAPGVASTRKPPLGRWQRPLRCKSDDQERNRRGRCFPHSQPPTNDAANAASKIESEAPNEESNIEPGTPNAVYKIEPGTSNASTRETDTLDAASKIGLDATSETSKKDLETFSTGYKMIPSPCRWQRPQRCKSYGQEKRMRGKCFPHPQPPTNDSANAVFKIEPGTFNEIFKIEPGTLNEVSKNEPGTSNATLKIEPYTLNAASTVEPDTSIETSKIDPGTVSVASKRKPSPSRWQRPRRCKQSDNQKRSPRGPCVPRAQLFSNGILGAVFENEPCSSSPTYESEPNSSNAVLTSKQVSFKINPDISNASPKIDPDSSNTATKIKKVTFKSEPDFFAPIEIEPGCSKESSKSELDSFNAASNNGPESFEPAFNIEPESSKTKTAIKSEIVSAKVGHKNEPDTFNAASNNGPDRSKASSNIELDTSKIYPKTRPSLACRTPHRCQRSADQEKKPAESVFCSKERDSRTDTAHPKHPRSSNSCRDIKSQEKQEQSKPTTVGEETEKTQLKFSKSPSEAVRAGSSSQADFLTCEGKRPPRCKRKDGTRQIEHGSSHLDTFYKDSAEGTHKKMKDDHHSESLTQHSCKHFPSQDQEYSLERHISEKSRENIAKCKKRHHRPQCPRRQDADIPQCQRRRNDQDAPQFCHDQEDAGDQGKKSDS